MIPVTPKIAKSMAVATERHNRKLSEPNPLFEQATEQFELTSQWPVGKTVKLLDGFLRGKRSIVGLKNIDGWVVCYIVVCGRTVYNSQMTIGYYDPGKGWSLASSATLQNFNIWQRRTTREINARENSGRL